MGKNKVIRNTNIPVTFQKVNQFDDRFVQVKIFLMHLGLNYNGSVFTKEAVETAIPSLKNTPILGYIKEDAIGQDDFAGHEMELVVEDGEYKFKYLGSAFGVIPETNNARWEKKVGDDGQEREYLVVDGLMWSKFDDAIGILNRDEIKGQSMELHNDYDGSFDEDGNFVFSKFSFYGACVLGDGVQPAMQRATVEKMFSTDELNSEVSRMMEEFKLNYGNLEINESKEGTDMTLEQLLEKYGVTAEQLTEKGINAEEFSIEDLEAKIQEEFKAEEETPENEEPKLENEVEGDSEEEPEDEVDENGSEDAQEDTVEEFEASEDESSEEEENSSEGAFERFERVGDKVVVKYALAHDDIRSILWEQINDYVEAKNLGERWDFWLQKVYDDHFIMQDEMSGKLYKVDYSKESDTITLGDNVEVFAEYLTADERGALAMLRNSFEALEGEVEELREFKRKVQETEHVAKAEDLFEQFALEEEEIKDLKENVHSFTLEEIEEKLFARLGRKNFSIKEPKNKMPVDNTVNTEGVKAPYAHLFSKFGK